MDQDKVKHALLLERSLRALAVGSYLFQCRVAEQLHLHPTDLQAVHVLGSSETGLSAGQLSSALGLTSGATTALIDRLTQLGYVERARDAVDRRRVTVRLRAQGLAPLRAQYRDIDKRIRKLIQQRSGPEIEIIALFVAQLVNDNA